jgi:hypothetical protein
MCLLLVSLAAGVPRVHDDDDGGGGEDVGEDVGEAGADARTTGKHPSQALSLAVAPFTVT